MVFQVVKWNQKCNFGLFTQNRQKLHVKLTVQGVLFDFQKGQETNVVTKLIVE